MTRIGAFGLGLVIVALFANGVLSGEDRGWIDDPAVLCKHGHPSRRLPTDYDGMLPRAGYERDHIVPRCLGGPDVLDNLQYQPLTEAHDKNIKREWPACEAYCRNPSPRLLGELRARFRREYQ